MRLHRRQTFNDFYLPCANQQTSRRVQSYHLQTPLTIRRQSPTRLVYVRPSANIWVQHKGTTDNKHITTQSCTEPTFTWPFAYARNITHYGGPTTDTTLRKMHDLIEAHIANLRAEVDTHMQIQQAQYKHD